MVKHETIQAEDKSHICVVCLSVTVKVVKMIPHVLKW